MVVDVSERCHINANGKVIKLVCGCKPDLAMERGCKGNCSCWRRRRKLCSPEACGCEGRCGRVKEAESPAPTAAQEHLKPVGVDRTLNMCFPMGGERESESDSVVSGTSDLDADGQLIDEDEHSDTSADCSPDREMTTLEELFEDLL